MGQRTSVYLDEDLHAAINASGIPLAELVRRGVAAGTVNEVIPSETADLPDPKKAAVITAVGSGEPSSGAVCATPSCWQKNTRKYGLRQVPLCAACAAALAGQ